MGQPSKPKRKTAKPAPSPRPGPGKKRSDIKNAGTPASTSGEARQLLLIRILETLNRTDNIKKLTHDILEMIKEHTGVEAIGLRLREGEDFPYAETIGLSGAFLKDEGALCARGPGGEIVREGVGYPVLECLCGAVLQGRADQGLPVFTPGGSFWTNDLSRYIASTPEARRPSRMRNRCLSEGYKSVTLIPLRWGQDIVGLLQFNDKRPGRFTLEMIRFLERVGASIAITVARQKSFEALKASQDLLGAVISGTSDAVYVKDIQGRYLLFNDAAAQIIGKDALGAGGQEEPLLFAADQEPAGADRDLGVIKDEKTVTVEESITTRSGETRTYLFTKAPLYDDRGRVSGMFAIAHDITERKEMEEALKESHGRYLGFFENAPIGMFHSLLDGGLLRVNRAAAAICGYDSAEEMVATVKSVPDQLYVHPEKRHDVIRKVLEHDGWVFSENEFRRKDGTSNIAKLSLRRVLKPDGTLAYIEGFVEDITERKRAEDALRASETQYRELADSITDIFFEMDRDLRYTYWNKASERLGGIPAREALGKSLLEVFPDTADIRKAEKVYREVVATQRPLVFLNDTTVGGKRYFFEISAYPSKRGLSVFVKDITERKRAEDALRDSEERFKGLFDDSVLGLYRTTPDGKVLMANPALCRMLGYDSVEELKKRNLEEDGFRPGYPRERFKKAIEEEGVIIGQEASWDLHGGGRIFVSESARAVKDASGRILYYEGSVEDITERRRAEILERAVYEIARAADEAKSLGDLYQSVHLIIKDLMPAANFLIALYDEKENLLDFPYFVDEIDSSPPSRKPGKGLTEYVLRTGNSLLCDAALEKELSRRGEAERIGVLSSCWLGVPLKARDKTIGVIALDNYSDPKAYGEREKQVLEYVSGQVANAIVRKQAEEALRESEERFRQLVENMSSGVAVYEARDGGRDFIIKDFNRAAEGIEAVARHDILGRSVLDVFPGVADFGLLEVFRRVWRTGEPEHFPAGVYRDQRITGWRESYVYRLPTGEVVAIFDDVTERKKAEEEIRSLNIELEERVRRRTALLEATNLELEAFAYSVSHDLGAPLRTIDGFALALLEETGSRLDERGRHFLNRIRAASQNMERLIVDLLKLSRVTRAEMTYAPVNLSAIVGKLAAELQAAHPDRRVEWVIAHGVKAEGDGQLLESALRDLLDNAYKFTAKHASARIEFGAQDRDGQTVYFVRDDGAGFDMAYAEKLFGVFQRLHRAEDFEGTGVGLATVQRIIRRHGGRAWAEGAVEQGATFYFSLAPENSASAERGKDGTK